MEILKWVEIIAEIIILIAGGLSKGAAVLKVAKMFKVSAEEIWKHGGF